MRDLKGLVLSGGRGTRLRPITHTRAKQLIPVANKPVLFYGLEALADAGVADVGVIVSPQTRDEIEAAAGDGSRFGLRLTYIVQDEPLGLAHAVLTAEGFLGSSPFVMYLGDNLLRDGITELVGSFRDGDADAQILLTPVHDPWNYGVAELDGERVVSLVEKPTDPSSDLALVGVYMFTTPVFDAARSLEPSGRGELEITDAIQALIDSGRRVTTTLVRGWWKDTGQVQDMLDANRLILEDLEERIEGELIDSSMEGPVVVERGARVERSSIQGPAIVGAGAVVRDARIGPFTALGDGTRIERAAIGHSIVMSGSSLVDLETPVEESLIGRDVRIEGSRDGGGTARFVVGDSAEIAAVRAVVQPGSPPEDRAP
jgi:glucose-1-phosphate thymidylyltransferase